METRQTLSELCDRFYELDETLSNIDPNTLPPELEEGLRELESDRNIAQKEFQQKADAYLQLAESRKAWIQIRKDRIKQLQRLVEIDENLVKKLCDRLMTILVERDIRQVRTENFNVSVARNGGKQPLLISDEIEFEDIPEEFLRVIVDTKIDRDKVRQSLESGEELGFARLGDRQNHLRIK